MLHTSIRTGAVCLALVMGGALALVGSAVDPAGATVPGANGKIAFTSSRDGNGEIYVMNSDGSAQQRLTNVPAFDGQPAWSPDGSKIAFSSQRDGPGNTEIYVMNADGSGQTRLTENTWGDFSPVWSPDGSKIAFTSYGGKAFYSIYVMNADGSGIAEVTATPWDDGADWSPDGSKIAFQRDSEIFVMNADGSGQTNLTKDPGVDAQPVWSPNGSKIAFVTCRDANCEVYVMNADGSNPENVTQSPADESTPYWSPDGTKISFGRDLGFPNSDVFVMNSDGSAETMLTSTPDLDVDAAWQAVPSADVAVSVAASPDIARSGKPLTYVITVHNAGPSNAHAVFVTDALSQGVRFVSAKPSEGSCVTPAVGSTGALTCALGFVPNSKSATAEIVVKVVAKKTTVTNTATVSSSTPDPSSANNSATIATQVH
jgi:uncharacterized repeat protein (TIGR01451 family)